MQARFKKLSLALIAGAFLATPALAGDADGQYQFYKDPNCGCCGKWADHMRDEGFSATVNHPKDLNAVKVKHGIAPKYQSCHTAVFDDKWAFEGHVPARYVEQFLKEKPEGAIGLAVPGMPMGSPGMEMGERFSPYQVLMIMEDGSHRVYAEIDSPEQQ